MVKAILLAAGQGTRLRPYTLDRPKAMVELVGMPMIERQCRVLERAGISDRVIVGGYRADRFASGRLVSLLEGGYDLQGLALSVAAHVGRLMRG